MFHRPANERLPELHILELSQEGLLEAANQDQISKGLYQFVVTPGMRIEVVNGVQGKLLTMIDQLTNSDSVWLRIRRAEVVTIAMEKMRNAIKAVGRGKVRE